MRNTSSSKPKRPRHGRDEHYVLDLCDRLLRRKSLRQHRFDFLLGDGGHALPVDAFYPYINVVIEYRERQHSEPVKFFDQRQTVSGVPRGEQRALYDQRRREELPRHRIELIELACDEFRLTSRKRLARIEADDIAVLRKRLLRYIPVDTGIGPPSAAVDFATRPPVITELLTRESVKAEQRALGTKRSAESKHKKNAERDQRIHDAHGKGQKLEAIAKAEGLKSHTTVSRILKRPRA